MQGLAVTFRHLLRNWPRNLFGRRAQSDIVTLAYPEEKRPYPPRNRGLHRLMKRADGHVRCVACMMCPTACPAHCISIVSEESEDPRIEKRPRIFQIDELRCVVCGLCVEACPCDAIRMDTGIHAWPTTRRADAILDKEELLSRGELSTAVQAGEGLFWREKT
jgi:NADH-quinone oxidoreductase subunit I